MTRSIVGCRVCSRTDSAVPEHRSEHDRPQRHESWSDQYPKPDRPADHIRIPIVDASGVDEHGGANPHYGVEGK